MDLEALKSITMYNNVYFKKISNWKVLTGTI